MGVFELALGPAPAVFEPHPAGVLEHRLGAHLGAADLIDVEAAEVEGEVLWDAFPGAVGTTFEDQYRRAMREQEAVAFEEYYPPLSTWFSVRAYPSESGLSVYFQDVTDRKRREQTLNERLAQQEVVSELSHEAIERADVDGFLRRATERTVETLSAYDLGVVTGRPAAEAAIALARAGIELPDGRVYAMESGPGKPAPDGLVRMADRLGADAVGFAGDTLDDVRTVFNARDRDPSRTYHAVGVLTGGHTGTEDRRKFESVGVDAVVADVNELPSLLE